MGLRKRFRDFRNWCPQPPDRLPSKLKRYSMPIAAIVTASIILSVSFFAFSGLMSNMLVPVIPLVDVGSSTNPNWTMFRADPSHDGVGTGNAVLTPKLLWKSTIANSSAGGYVGSTLWIN